MMVFHIRTGDARTARVVDQWIAQHALEARVMDDPYRACAFLVTSPQAVPELVFIGVDRLHADECRIISYVHETWPGASIVTYGAVRGAALPPGACHHCGVDADMKPILAAGGLRDVIRSLEIRPALQHAPDLPRRLSVDEVVRPPAIELPPPRPPAPDRPSLGGSATIGGLSPREIAALLGGGAG